MSPRQRGAAWFMLLLLCGHGLDRLDLGFEAPARPTQTLPRATPADSTARPAMPGNAVARPKPPEDTAPIAINRASARELQALPRVGPVLAARIVAYRDAHGPFHDARDLEGVPGIGPRTAARLASLLRFD